MKNSPNNFIEYFKKLSWNFELLKKIKSITKELEKEENNIFFPLINSRKERNILYIKQK